MASAQQTQQYFHVEFNIPITGSNSVATTMRDDYTYCNPLNEYLDFNANSPMSFRQVSSAYYLDNGRTTTTAPGTTEAADMPFSVDKIKKISAYSIPVEKVELTDSTTTHDITFIGNGKTYQGAEFTFNRLPRNVAELKTLIEPNGDGVRSGCDNPLYVAAVMYLIWPRLLGCSQDCRDMLDYMYGTQYSQLATTGMPNESFRDLCTSEFTGNNGKDASGLYLHNHLFQHFAGATPGNEYKPNGKDYWTGPYKVRVVWDRQTPTQVSSSPKCTIARILLMPNPDATSKSDISFDDPTSHFVTLRSTNKNGWFFYSNEKKYYTKGKDQIAEDF